MIMIKKFMSAFVAMCAATILLQPFASGDTAAFVAASATKILDRNAVWVVDETTRLADLTIAGGADIQSPEGCSVTMTVNGIGTAIRPGAYKGDIVLTVTREIKSPGGNPAAGEESGGFLSGGGAPAGDASSDGPPEGGGGIPGGGSPPFRTAVYVENGKYVPEKSVAAAVAAGNVTDTSATDVKITSEEGFFSGIIVAGDAKYSIINPVIDLSGNGGDDWKGLGAAITVTGKAEVTIENAKIRGSGYNRSAIFAGGDSIVHVNNSYIEVDSGILNEYPSFLGSKTNKNMLVGPWLMGMYGRVRATNVLDNVTIYYNNTHIKSHQWGCLSTDGPKKIRLYATDCLIETVDTGYGAYSIGDCHDYFSGCTFNVVDYGLIICDFASGTFTDGCVVNSRKVGVMMHDGSGGSTLTIEKGTEFNTRSSVIQIKGRRGADIFVDDSRLNSEEGIILQTMPNDDPNMSAWDYAGGSQEYSRDVNATFSNMALNGDIVNGFTRSGSVNVTLRSAIITGAVTTATAEHPLLNGEEITMETSELYYLIGEVNNVYCAKPDDPHGISVSLDTDSKWVVEETSYLTGLSIAKGAAVTAPEGYSVAMTVDGAKKQIKAGAYKGRIVLRVTKNT